MKQSEGRTASWEKFHRQTAIHRFTQRKAAEVVTGVCLWGPPGSGKSSGLAHIKELLGDETLLSFNVDDYCRFIVCEYMFELYSSYVMAKQQPNPDPRILEEESELRRQIGTRNFPDIVALIQEKGDKAPPESLFAMINKYIVMHMHVNVEHEMWEQFKSELSIVPEEMETCAVFRLFGPWMSKRIGRHFVYEMTGRHWQLDFHQMTYGDVNSLLYIPFVYDMEALVQRVVGRKDQFGNIGSDGVRNIFQVSYGESLLKAMDSGLYSQIIVQGNSSVNYVMMSLERVGGEEDGTPQHYVLLKEFANDMQEALYIDALLHAIMLPDDLKHNMTLAYDLNTKRWRVAPQKLIS